MTDVFGMFRSKIVHTSQGQEARRRAKLAQLETLLKQGRTILQDLRTQVDDTKKSATSCAGNVTGFESS